MNRNEEQKLATLSPFEVKDTLMRLADENNSHTMINAGRGNPNWLATVPRDAFFHLGLFALQESKATYSTYPGFGGMSEKDNISTRFLSFCEDHEHD